MSLPAALIVMVAGKRGAIHIFLERTDIRRQHLRQHRHDAIREIDAVPSLSCFPVERSIRPDIEADVRDSDDRLEAALVIRIIVRLGPHRIIMIARIGWVDRDDREMPQILTPFTQRQLRNLHCLFERFIGEGMRQPVFVESRRG